MKLIPYVCIVILKSVQMSIFFIFVLKIIVDENSATDPLIYSITIIGFRLSPGKLQNRIVQVFVYPVVTNAALSGNSHHYYILLPISSSNYSISFLVALRILSGLATADPYKSRS